ncbi:hypothetical protein Acor_40910 [Acrocarpospora corrugata]|uniref:Uncharacterized protein n=1 Tax=Acrocarpospora corrugata TaxID=35763 RepID=A0A5M3VZT5_9ACTN|nr:hypothetical protein [Acrocarpospora corrugata]GES02026.1 hypothetical protein Acor_40910 [Acrocarpospora corrugata]
MDSSPPGESPANAPDETTPEATPIAVSGAEISPNAWLHSRTCEAIDGARRISYASADQACSVLQRGDRMTSEVLFSAAHAQALDAWWGLIADQIDFNEAVPDHALRRIRSWARRYLTAEPAATEPGTLFDHALAHVSRAAARHFLQTSGRLLVEHANRRERTAREQESQTTAKRQQAPDPTPSPGSGDANAQDSHRTERT